MEINRSQLYFHKNEKNSLSVFLQGQRFRFQRTQKGTSYFRCSIARCKSRLILYPNSAKLTRLHDACPHLVGPSVKKVMRDIIKVNAQVYPLACDFSLYRGALNTVVAVFGLDFVFHNKIDFKEVSILRKSLSNVDRSNSDVLSTNGSFYGTGSVSPSSSTASDMAPFDRLIQPQSPAQDDDSFIVVD